MKCTGRMIDNSKTTGNVADSEIRMLDTCLVAEHYQDVQKNHNTCMFYEKNIIAEISEAIVQVNLQCNFLITL